MFLIIVNHQFRNNLEIYLKQLIIVNKILVQLAYSILFFIILLKMKSLQLLIMKTIKNTNLKLLLGHQSIKMPVLFVAIIFLWSLSGFIPGIKTSSNSELMPGVVFEIEVTDHEQSPPKVESFLASVEGKNLKMEILPDRDGKGKGQMIFRGNRGKNGEVVITDDDTKSYYVMDDAFVESMLGKIDQSKGMMQEALKNLPKEQRDMIEKMQKENGVKIPGMTPPITKPKLTKTNEKSTKMGYPCVKYEVHLNGIKTREIWTTDWKNIDGGGEAKGAFNAMNNFFENIKDKFGAGDFPEGKDLFEEMNFENGFPVVTREFSEDTGSFESESALKSSSRRTLDPADFEPPAGYKRRSMMGGY